MFLISKKSFTKSRVGKTFLKHPISWQCIFLKKRQLQVYGKKIVSSKIIFLTQKRGGLSRQPNLPLLAAILQSPVWTFTREMMGTKKIVVLGWINGGRTSINPFFVWFLEYVYFFPFSWKSLFSLFSLVPPSK